MLKNNLFFIALFFSFLPTYLFAHGGGLNAQGCHNETKTGGYHCHRSSYTPPPATYSTPSLNSSTQSTNTSSTKDVKGTFTTGISGVVFKNVRCLNSKWVLTIINRNTSYKHVDFIFYTVDSDGDPLKKFSKNNLGISAKSRADLTLDNFNCNTTPFTSLKYSIGYL